MPVKSFIVDFHDHDFKSVLVKVSNLSGETLVEYELGDVKQHTFAEMNIPADLSRDEVVITVTSEGKSLVEKADIFAAR